MVSERQVLVHSDVAALAAEVAARFIGKVAQAVRKRDVSHVVLTGGRVGAEVLRALVTAPGADQIDWAKVHFWWGDERWLPAGDAERNDTQARDAFFGPLGIDLAGSNVHTMGASDAEGADLDQAARDYAAELASFSARDRPYPHFDVTLLGVGPDGHVASLFPEHLEVRNTTDTVLPVRNSPKPPPERITLTLPVINSSNRVWLCLAGTDKASPLGLALAGAGTNDVPAAGVHGQKRTVFFVDQDAAAEVPESLITPSY